MEIKKKYTSFLCVNVHSNFASFIQSRTTGLGGITRAGAVLAGVEGEGAGADDRERGKDTMVFSDWPVLQGRRKGLTGV